MINVQQGIYIQNQLEISREGDLLKWIHNNGAMNISVAIMYSIVDSIINAFSSSLRQFDPKRRVSTIIESFSFHKERLRLLLLSTRVFL